MTTLKKLLVCLALIMAVAGLSGCSEGPAEKAGKNIDKAAEDAGKAVEDAAEKVEDAMKKDN